MVSRRWDQINFVSVLSASYQFGAARERLFLLARKANRPVIIISPLFLTHRKSVKLKLGIQSDQTYIFEHSIQDT